MDEVFDVPVALDGERLDRALALLTGLTRKEVDEIVAAGRVRLGSVPASSRSRRLHTGEHIRVEGALVRPVPEAPGAEEGVPFEVVWSDAEVVVVDKPAGVVVHPGSGNRKATLVNGLLDRFPDMAGAFAEPAAAGRPGVVHRLDKGTSGLLVFARTRPALQSLQHQMAERSTDREYLALVAGDLESDSGAIEAPIGRSVRDPVRMQVQADGRRARTGYEVEERFASPVRSCLVRCRLETGRTHQIRVHFASIGHPVVGDDRYGTRKAGTRKAGSWEPLPAGRQFLHARMLSFDHPSTGRRLSFESPLPQDLLAVLDALRGR